MSLASVWCSIAGALVAPKASRHSPPSFVHAQMLVGQVLMGDTEPVELDHGAVLREPVEPRAKRERVGGAEQREHDPARYERVFLGADVGGIQREV